MLPGLAAELPMATPPLSPPTAPAPPASVRAAAIARRQRLRELLRGDLDFRGSAIAAAHHFHAFAARFPPQLPALFIEALTKPGDRVLDPLMGSGTTVLEAHRLGRCGIGCDLDPLAVRQARVKTTPVDGDLVRAAGERVIAQARAALSNPQALDAELERRYEPSALAFLRYWFLPRTQRELLALLLAIEAVPQPAVRAFLEIAFSSIIITKSGGVSLARDLAHSRPHRVAKTPKDAIDQFAARLAKNLALLDALPEGGPPPRICRADARALPFAAESVDLVVTSPPYANAIDYMRAHKFSLVWFGKSPAELARLRRRYIGSEFRGAEGVTLPPRTQDVVARVHRADPARGRILRKYYGEMTATLREICRVTRAGAAVILVVGSSTMRGIDTETHHCLREIAAAIGFETEEPVERRLDRDRRMLPARWNPGARTRIEQRMHREYLIAALKPL